MRARHILVGAVTAVLAATGISSGHVKYVSEEGEELDPLGFLLSTLSEPLSALLLGGGALGVAVVVALYVRFRPLQIDMVAARRALRTYRDLIPWMLRLSVGLPLVGAGYNGYLFSPVVTPETDIAVRLFGIGVGFLLLFGFATRLVAGIGLAGYLVGLVIDPRVLLAFEYLPAFVAIVLVGGGRPSADHMIHQVADDGRTLYSRLDPIHLRVVEPFRTRIEPYRSLAPTVIRVGLGIAFIYLGLVEKLLSPAQSLAVVAKYDLTAVAPVPPELWVVGAGMTEIVLGLVLIAGLLTRGAAAVAFVMFTITLFGLPDDPVLAHVSLFGLASVLLVTGSGPFAIDGRFRWHNEASLTD
ncbi:MAG: DoxX family protein [Haloferacaceae archaeon]